MKVRTVIVAIGLMLVFGSMLVLILAVCGVFDAKPKPLDTTSTIEPPLPSEVPDSVPFFASRATSRQRVRLFLS